MCYLWLWIVQMCYIVDMVIIGPVVCRKHVSFLLNRILQGTMTMYERILLAQHHNRVYQAIKLIYLRRQCVDIMWLHVPAQHQLRGFNSLIPDFVISLGIDRYRFGPPSRDTVTNNCWMCWLRLHLRITFEVIAQLEFFWSQCAVPYSVMLVWTWISTEQCPTREFPTFYLLYF